MIKSLLNTIDLRERPTVRDRLQDLLDDMGPDRSLSSRLFGTSYGSYFRPARSKVRRAASRTSSYVSAHPRQVGLSVGAAALLAVGIFAIARSHESRKQEERPTAQAEPAE